MSTDSQVVQAIPQFEPEDAWSRAEIEMPPGQKPLDEMLLLYSRTAQANIFADVTGISLKALVEPRSQPFPGAKIKLPTQRGFMLRNLASQTQMWSDRTEPDTFVVWPIQDLNKLTSLIVAEQHKLDEANPVGDRTATLAALQNFLTEKGWKPNAETVDEKNQRAQGLDDAFRLNDLPPALRGPVLAELVLRLRTLTHPYLLPAAWTDDYWKDARVRLQMPNLDNKGRQLTPGALPQVHIRPPSIPGFTDQLVMLGEVRGFKMNWQGTQAHNLPRLARPLLPRHRPVCAPDTETEMVETPPIAPRPQAAPALDAGFTFDASQEAALQKKVSFTHQGVAPSVVVSDWSRQSGVSLQLAPDIAPSKIVALSGGMTLSSAMTALARLLSAKWSKEGDGFVLRSANLDELHLMMARLGERAYYPFVLRDSSETRKDGDELAQQIVLSVDEDQLKSKDGVTFSALPPELQKGVLALTRENSMGNIIVSQQRVYDALSPSVLSPDVQLRFSPLKAGTPLHLGYVRSGLSMGVANGSQSTRLNVFTADGRYIISIFPELQALLPSEEIGSPEWFEAMKARQAQQKEQNR